MMLTAEPRTPNSPEPWLETGYVLGTTPGTWPKVVREAKRVEEEQPAEPEVNLAEALSDLGRAVSQKVAQTIGRIARWRPLPAKAEKLINGIEIIPDVEYLVVPHVGPKRTVRLEGYVRSIQRGREELSLSDADLAGLFFEEGDG
jgi:hypothetical protein